MLDELSKLHTHVSKRLFVTALVGVITILVIFAGSLWYSAKPATSAVETFRDCLDCPVLVGMPSGQFIRGSSKSEQPRRTNEGPQLWVRFFRPYAIGAFEVTREEWAVFVKDTGYAESRMCILHDGTRQPYPQGDAWAKSGIAQTDRDPVVCISPQDARAYTAWLSRRTGKQYRLPTESEWEYAARAGTTTPFWWGDKIDTARANCNGCGSLWDFRSTAPVGSFKPNPAGLYDMNGNAWEITEDCYVESLYRAPVDGSAERHSDCKAAAIRGGAWDVEPIFLRSAARAPMPLLVGTNYVGFRVARDIEPTETHIKTPVWR